MITKALEIEKIKPCENGVYVCINEETKEFKIMHLQECTIIINGSCFTLKNYLEMQNNKITQLIENYNKLVEILIEKNKEV